MKSLQELQNEVEEWSHHNFGNHPAYHPLLGIQEEVGELSHHYLKREQHIRNNEDHEAGIEDSVADLIIYLLDFCNCEGIDLSISLEKVWTRVKERDWKQNSKDGQKSS